MPKTETAPAPEDKVLTDLRALMKKGMARVPCFYELRKTHPRLTWADFRKLRLKAGKVK